MAKSKDEEIADLKAQLDAANANLAKASAPANTSIAVPKAADLDTYKDGEWKRISDGVTFKLKKVKPDESQFNRTHLLKNETSFVELTESDFRAQFEKP